MDGTTGAALDPTVVGALCVGALTLLLYLWWSRNNTSASGEGGGKGGAKRDRIAEARRNNKFDVEAAAAACKSSGQPWKDPHFGHDAYPGNSIGDMELRDGERGKPLVLGQDGVTWQPPWKFSHLKRPLGVRHDGVPTWLYSDNDKDGIVSAAESMETADAVQGSVGDCYFLAALAAVVQHHPDLAEDLIDETHEAQGIYGVTLWRRGKWRMTWVDGYFPCYRPSAKSHRGKHRLVFAGASDGKEIWTLVVEKAFAKVAGSYDAISGGQVSAALEMLTGGRGRRRRPKDLASEWDQLKEDVLSDEHFVGAGSQQLAPNNAVEQKKALQGIVTGHAYTICNVYEGEESSLRLVELRNPWGRVMYHGDWGPGSRKWNDEEGREARAVVGTLRTREGRFWMAWEDFVACFDSVDICHLNFSEEDRAHRAALREEAAQIVAKQDRPQRQESTGNATGDEGQAGESQESADAMMALLLAEDAKDKRMKKKTNNVRRGGKNKGGK